MKRLLITDIGSTNINNISEGHYMAVAENYIKVFGDIYNCYIMGGPIYKRKFRKNFIELKYDTVSNGNIFLNKIKQLYNIKQVFKICKKEDVIIFQSSAVVTAYVGIALFGNSIPSIYMIQYSGISVQSKFKQILYRMARPRISGIICTSKEAGETYDLPYCVVPDYIYPENLDGDGTDKNIRKKYDFGMIGIISDDKGVVEAIKHLRGTKFRVLVAGKPQNDKIKRELMKLSKEGLNIEYRLGYLPEEEYDQLIRECRYCILNYSDSYSDHSSGVVYDILFRKVPVIGRKCGFLMFIQEKGLGYLFDDIEKWNIDYISTEADYPNLVKNIECYCREHSKFNKRLIEFLEGKCTTKVILPKE